MRGKLDTSWKLETDQLEAGLQAGKLEPMPHELEIPGLVNEAGKLEIYQ